MQCCVPFCKSSAEVVSESTGITFHEFPSEVHLRAAWLRALGTQDNLPDSAVVCSQHFLNDDISETQSGSRQIRCGAIPSTVQVCMICFDTQSKLYPMSKYKLDEAYQRLVGHPMCDQGNLKQTLCVQCAQRLVNFDKFRDKSLRARSLMLELVEKHELITMHHTDIFNEMNTQLKHNIVPTVLKPDHCDLYINTDKQTDILSTVKPVVKSEVSEVRSESMSVDEDITEYNAVVRNENTENSLNINLVVTKEEYVSDEELKQTTDPLFVKPSTSKDEDDVPLAQIKYEITFECSVCSEEFVDEESYNYHMSAHIEENRHLAEDNAEFGQPSVSPSSFATKSKQNYMNKALYVEISPVETIAPVARKVPRKFKKSKKQSVNSEINDGNEKYICNICHAKFKHKFSLHRHLRTHADEYPYTCQFCDYKCTVRYSLDTHMRNHTGDKPFICETCKFRFARNFDLVKHMKTHTSEKPHTCEVCEFKFKRKSGLIEHMKKHSDDKPYSCELCEYKAVRNSDLVRHMKSHTGDKPFACDLCEYKCIRRCNLSHHMKTHTGDKPFICDICKFRFARNFDLVKHMKTHTSEKPHTCEVCEFKFKRKSGLIEHMKTHSDDKPYSCELCEYKAIRNSDLVRHMKSHTGDKPFACDLCEYKCIRRCNLAHHMMSHTGDKPFICEICGLKCSSKANLRRHMFTHTGNSQL